MKIKTTRFGELEVNKSDILTFNEGILGFENLKKFFIVDPGDQTLILWFQSSEDPATAFPIIEPKIFKPDYVVKLMPSELNSLGLESVNEASVYTILTIPKDITQMSANLKAPIIINNKQKLARQVVLQNSKLEVKLEMYKELKKYIFNYTSDDSKRTKAQHSSEVSVVATKAESTPQKSSAPKENKESEA